MDHLPFVLANLCGFMLIFADQFAEVQRFESLSFPPRQMFHTFLVCMGGSGEYFSTDLVQCDGASWQLLAGVVPAQGVAMDTSPPWPEVLMPTASI